MGFRPIVTSRPIRSGCNTTTRNASSAVVLGPRDQVGEVVGRKVRQAEGLVQWEREVQVGADADFECAAPDRVVQHVATALPGIVQKMHVPARDADALLVQGRPETGYDTGDVVELDH